MSAIVVENLSKCYQIGHQMRHDTLRDALSHRVRSLFSRRDTPRADREDFWALRDVTFTVQPGEVVGVIGRNGAGKSTLLKILSRITDPTKGRVSINGRVASLLEVGTGFHPELSGRENIFLNGAILGMSRAEIRRKFDEIVSFAEVERFLDTPVKRYSSGMYVRLAFAVAAHLEPEILIVDEVLAVGDAQFQKKCLGKMQEVASGQGRTVLFVSHNMAAVEQLCPRAVLLEAGRLIQHDDSRKVIAHHFARTMPASGRSPRPGRPAILSADLRFEPASGRCLGEIEVFWPEAGSIAIEAVVHDARRNPVALAQVGSLNRNDALDCPAGSHRFTFEFDGSALADGAYWVTWQIMRPWCPVLDRFELTAPLQICQPLVDGSRSFEQTWQSGSVRLAAKSTRQGTGGANA